MEHAFRLVELLGALSLTTDLGAGVPFEKGLRTCAVAARLADVLGLSLGDRRAAYLAALLRSLGWLVLIAALVLWVLGFFFGGFEAGGRKWYGRW